jgi:prepilin-type N-terminal cleavage/methylation domain-containing protein
MPVLVSIATIQGRQRRSSSRTPLRAADEAGFTLIELLVAMALAVGVFGAILSMLATSQRVEARDTEWALTLQKGRVGLARMAREIRQASKVETAEASTIGFKATIGGTEYLIKYECGLIETGTKYKCVRFAAKAGESLPTTGTPIVRGLINGTEIFKYFKQNVVNTTAPTYVTLKLELPASGSLKQVNSSAYKDHIVLTDAAYMRNLDLEG